MPAASRPIRQTAIAILLCLLAFSFAFEARMSRYSSAEGYGSDVHASRVLAPDSRDLSPGETSSSAPESLAFFCVFVSIVTAMFLLTRKSRPWNVITRESRRALNGSFFSPQIAFRPPPVR